MLGECRIGERERRLIATSDLFVTALYAEIHGFFDSVIDAPSPGLRTVDFSDLADFDGGTDIVERYLERLDIGFFGLRAQDRDLIAALEQLARRHGKLFVATLGPEGCVALGGEERIARAATPAPAVVDTTGAGDVFAAGRRVNPAPRCLLDARAGERSRVLHVRIC